MIIECTSCRTKYHYETSRFGSAQTKKIRCTKCAAVFEIKNPNLGDPLNPPPGQPDASMDATALGGGARRRPSGEPPAIPSNAGPALRPPDTIVRSTEVRDGTGERRLKLSPGERLSLACIAGPDAGKIYEINKPRVIVGRPNADILLSDGECSRSHAAIEISEDQVVLIDLGSTNGTFVGERRVQETTLENRSEFDVGASTLMFIRSRKD